MKTKWLLLLPLLWLASQIGAQALNPTKVDGTITVKVDRSDRIWSITVTNDSKQKLTYEMMGKVPRGLGLEVWDDENREKGWRVHAEDLAEYLNVDGFPADIREISPGDSEVFQLNPESMSTRDDLALANWERAKRKRYYTCRVFFGVYASRLIDVSPRRREKVQADAAQHQVPPTWDADAEDGADEGDLFGFQFRRMLNEKNLALVDWNSLHGGVGMKEGQVQITYTTCAKVDLERMPS